LEKQTIDKLLKKLKNINQDEIRNFNVVLLPDFFVDHFLTFKNLDETIVKIKKVYEQGGGNIPNVLQKINQGGNSANTALALAKLGISSHLICRTDELGFNLLKFFLGKKDVDISHVKKDGKLAITTAFEFENKNANIMIGDTGSVSNFSFEDLDKNDLDLIARSDLLCVTTWNLNKEGSMLAKKAFNFAKKNNTITYFDIGDPSTKPNEINSLLENVLKDNNLDILGLNENEIQYLSGQKVSTNDELIKVARQLKEKINGRIDLHTQDFTCSIKTNPIIVPSIEISEKYRSTGAGDAWNAGNIFGELLGFNDNERLFFANCVAGLYILSSKPIHPNLDGIIKYLNDLGKI